MGKEIGITVKKSEDFSEWYTQNRHKIGIGRLCPS